MVKVSDSVELEVTDGVAIISIDNPPVNALSECVRNGLHSAVMQASGDDSADAMLVVCKGRTYFAGADIREFGLPPRGISLLDVHDTIESAPKPIISAIHGTALGGGLETALCCHFRIAVDSAQFGLPEVKLGLLPGAGGTQRLPRIVGVQKALEMMTSGEPVDAKFALECGLVDEIVEDLLEGGLAFAKKVVVEGRPLVKVRDLETKIEGSQQAADLFNSFRATIAEETRGFEAPEAIIRCVEDSVTLPYDDCIRRERERFQVLVQGDKSAAQRYCFFAARQANKIPDVPKDTARIQIHRVGVLGAGMAGGEIAIGFLDAGLAVSFVDVDGEALDRGVDAVREKYDQRVESGSLSRVEADRRLENFVPSPSLNNLADCDLVVENDVEFLGLKKKIFRQLDEVVKEGAILSTNTSALDINTLAAVTGRPELVLGTHFFDPVHTTKLCEVVRGERTSNTALATIMNLVKRVGKVAVVAKVGPGLIGDRMMLQCRTQAEKMIYDGPLPWDVDRVIYEFGMPLGPFANDDLAGLDVGWNTEPSQTKSVRERLCEIGRRGQRVDAGYYDYDPKTGARSPAPAVQKVIEKLSAKRGVVRRPFSDEEILERAIYPLINEGAKILQEGISLRPSDVDVVWVHGFGWPMYRGGPMYFADTIGLPNVLAKLKKYQQQDRDDFWQPAPLIETLVAQEQGFGAYYS